MNTCLSLDDQALLPDIHLVYLPGDPAAAAGLLIARDMRHRTIAVLSLDIHGDADGYAAVIHEPVLAGRVSNTEPIVAHMLDHALRIVSAAGVHHVCCETWSGAWTMDGGW